MGASFDGGCVAERAPHISHAVASSALMKVHAGQAAISSPDDRYLSSLARVRATSALSFNGIPIDRTGQFLHLCGR